ncbi:hypothetical protein WR25_04950 isoform B [Diploscapter pachys]|uniref:Uncharacterized protein n=1 Tax=Diploscapter pachys TaxID=2018661 RepID=A0A2A2JQU2_9BILA|nr:hypothetical protein WR25_04950 isoform B [Diploscapter pachys]
MVGSYQKVTKWRYHLLILSRLPKWKLINGSRNSGVPLSEMWGIFNGPQLYRIFGLSNERAPNTVETIGNYSLSTLKGLLYVSTSLAFGPVVLYILYNRGMLAPIAATGVLKYIVILGIFGYGGRFVGRLMDSDYRQFVGVWEKAKIGTAEDKQSLKRYDFELIGVTPDYRAVENRDLWYLPAYNEGSAFSNLLATYAVHAFGRHMIYPGSMAILNTLMSSTLRVARNNFVASKNGQRVWLNSTTGDLIDAMFIPPDSSADAERQRTLVICCEGNAGFYEIGITNTPIQLGYGVLGFNQPGFAESNGLPFPTNVLAAAEAVFQYATNVLQYREEDIVLFGWSIGGFPASWLAANHPNVKALILDATFDDLLPLAESRMPSFLHSIVEVAIRKYFNLEIHRILEQYRGPLRLIRRLHEEILIIDDQSMNDVQKRATNRANYLLKKVLYDRHPDLIKDLEPQVDRWLKMTPAQRAMSAGLERNATESANRLAKLLSACDHYFVDFDANHVTPLDPGYFNIPMARTNF